MLQGESNYVVLFQVVGDQGKAKTGGQMVIPGLRDGSTPAVSIEEMQLMESAVYPLEKQGSYWILCEEHRLADLSAKQGAAQSAECENLALVQIHT